MNIAKSMENHKRSGFRGQEKMFWVKDRILLLWRWILQKGVVAGLWDESRVWIFEKNVVRYWEYQNRALHAIVLDCQYCGLHMAISWFLQWSELCLFVPKVIISENYRLHNKIYMDNDFCGQRATTIYCGTTHRW